MPSVESFSLFKAEEPQDEAETLSALGLTSIHASQPQIVQEGVPEDVPMTDSLTTPPTDNYPTQNFRDSVLPPAEPKQQISVVSTHSPQPKPSNVLEAARSTIDLHSTVGLLKMPLDNIGGSSSVASNPVQFPREDRQDGDEEMPLIDLNSDSEDEATD